MNQPATVTPLHPVGGVESDEDSVASSRIINFYRFPKIPKGCTILDHFGEGYLPETWDGDIGKIRMVPITPGPDGQAGKAFAALLKAGELNLTANAMEHLLSMKLSGRYADKTFLLTGTRYVIRKNGIEFVRGLSTIGSKIEEVCVTEKDRVAEDTYALVLKD